MSKDVLKTPVGRIAFCNLLEAREEQSGDEFYSCTIIFDGKTAKDKLIDAMKSAANEAAKAKFNGKVPKNLKSPFLDQSNFLNDDTDEPYGGFEDENLVAIRCKTKRKPQIVDANGGARLDEASNASDQVYAGMYGRLSLTCYAYDHQGNKGVSFGLCNVLKTDDGAKLGGGSSSAADDFADDITESTTSEDDLF